MGSSRVTAEDGNDLGPAAMASQKRLVEREGEIQKVQAYPALRRQRERTLSYRRTLVGRDDSCQYKAHGETQIPPHQGLRPHPILTQHPQQSWKGFHWWILVDGLVRRLGPGDWMVGWASLCVT